MANTDHLPSLLSDSAPKQDVQPSDAVAEPNSPASEQPTPPAPPESRPQTAPARPTLIQLGSSNSQASSSTPHPPKKFNAVNINKKFLEKTSAAAAMATASSASAAGKSNTSMSRPQIQTAQSHSRLVTAKLTGSPAPSSTTGPGWSRPNSTAPSSTGTNSPIGSSPLPSNATAVSINSVAPQLPHVGKVIQPQPRAAIFQNTNLQKEGNSVKHTAKPAWGAVKPPPSVAPIMTSEDFPTAAEVAKATATRKPKPDDLKASSPDSGSVSKHRLEEEADTFRGVHLDPNAHHWDEMEEDNDDFLGGVIEFGDGRQYKVEATEPSTSPAPPDEPVSKEDRFVDDFDRSWPKSKPSPPPPVRDFPTSPALSSRGTSLQGQQDHLHPQLFNERSNRLEPYSHTSRPPGGSGSGSGSGGSSSQSTYHHTRRGSYNEGPTSPGDPRKGNFQLLQKTGNGELPPRPPRNANGAPGPTGRETRAGYPPGHIGDRRDTGPSQRRDHHHPPPSPRMTRNDWGLPQPHDMAPSTSLPGRDRDERGRRSDMGPPPTIPLHAMTRRPSQESSGGRQLPPHLSPNMSLPRRLPSRDRDREGRFPAPTSPQSSRFGPPSPSLSHHSSALALSPAGASSIGLPPLGSAVSVAAGAGADLNEVTKDLMQNAAARAKARKQQEEAEREAQKERARKKAAELEEKMKKEQEEKEKDKNEEEEVKVKEQEKEAVAFIESVVSAVEVDVVVKSPLAERRPSIDAVSLPQNLPRRPQSLRGQQRRVTSEAGTSGVGVSARRPSFGIGSARAPPSAAPDVSPAAQADSWRAKANPLPPPPPRQAHSRPPPPPSRAESTLSTVPSTALDQVADIAENSMSDLEVVDFSNMDKFVDDGEGEKEKSENGEEKEVEVEVETKQEAAVVVPTKARPTASDFFEDNKPSSPAAPTGRSENVWRRKTSATTVTSEISAQEEVITVRPSGSAPVLRDAVSSSHPVPHPRVRPHAEASMSALDDVMSRIRGAIDAASKENPSQKSAETQTEPHYHHHHHHHQPHHPPPRISPSTSTSTTAPVKRERWLPPPKFRTEEKLEELRESLSTSTEPPAHSPLPTSSSDPLTVALPTVSHRIEPVPRRQQLQFSRPPNPIRFELLSFEPPVPGMNKRDFSVNSVLFKQTTGFKGHRIRIALPNVKGGGNVIARTVSVGAKYSNHSSNGVGGTVFGRQTNADEAVSWRRAGSGAVSAAAKVEEKGREGEKENISGGGNEKDKDSGAGARDRDSAKDAVSVKLQEEPQGRGHASSRVMMRQQPKMPAGSAVAFIRDSRIDVVEADPKPLVNFIVTSELDDPVVSSASASEGEKEKVVVVVSQARDGNGSTSGTKAGMGTNLAQPLPSTSSPTANPKVSEVTSVGDSTTCNISAPSPSHQSTSTSWGRAALNVPIKDAGAVRAPDPEHLKAVWSQPANKLDLNPVNSLEGIADDLAPVPFSIQEVKSEDGETPPPVLPSTTSRLSLHEVTRAFQKVPSSSSSSNSNSNHQNRNVISPPSSNNTPARASPYAYSPIPANVMRQHSYEHYSPMLSHSPSPVVYPHPLTSSPVPSRMPVNGHAPMYQGPIWIPQPTPAPGNPGSVMRPMMSPYNTPMMPYPAPNTPVYPPHHMGAMPAPQPPVGTAAAGRGRGVPMMSPAMQHAHAHAHAGAPMYAGSPVMMHMQPVPHQNHASHPGAYMSVHAPPPHAGVHGRGQPRTDSGPQATNATPGQQPHHPSSYNPASFVRSTW